MVGHRSGVNDIACSGNGLVIGLVIAKASRSVGKQCLFRFEGTKIV